MIPDVGIGATIMFQLEKIVGLQMNGQTRHPNAGSSNLPYFHGHYKSLREKMGLGEMQYNMELF